MPRIEMVVWDAAKVFPDGPENTTPDTKTQASDEFVHSLVRMVVSGGELLAVLPLVEPGRALLVY